MADDKPIEGDILKEIETVFTELDEFLDSDPFADVQLSSSEEVVFGPPLPPSYPEEPPKTPTPEPAEPPPSPEATTEPSPEEPPQQELAEKEEASSEPPPNPDETMVIKTMEPPGRGLDTNLAEILGGTKPSKSSTSETELSVPEAKVDDELAKILKTPSNKPKKSVGEGLGALEQALAASQSGGLSQAQQQRSRVAMGFLANIPMVERALVAYVLKTGELRAAAVGGMEGDYLKLVSQRLIRRTLADGKPLMLVDAQKDPRFSADATIQGMGIRSVLCVPFNDLKSGLKGVLYADNRHQPAAFTYGHLSDATEFAEVLSTQADLSQFAPAAVATEQADIQAPVEAASLQIYAAFAAVIVVAILLLAMAHSIQTNEVRSVQQAVETAPPDLSRRPYGLAREFLEQLAEGRVESARSLLSSRAQRRLQVTDLEKLARSWNLSEGSAPQVLQERVTGSKALVKVGRPGDEPGQHRSWTFIKEDGWKLDQLETDRR